MPPNAMSNAQISCETDITELRLYTWRNEYRTERKAVPAAPSNPENWSREDKLTIVIETAALNEARALGVQPAQGALRRADYPLEGVRHCRDQVLRAPDQGRAVRMAEGQKKSRQLEKELTQKEKALVEAAALLVPGEKAKATWGDDGEAYNDNGGHYIFSFLEY